MDLMTIIGFIAGMGFMVLSIILGEDPDTGRTAIIFAQLKGFFDPASIMIVVGGTAAALMISYPLEMFKKIPKTLGIALKNNKLNPRDYINQIVEFAREARVNGILTLEEKINGVNDRFMRTSLMMVVDSVEPDKVKTLMDTELDNMESRHTECIGFYLKGAEYSPAFGMIGTLIGLINLLANLSDQEALATNMAVALVTTLYGCILANLLFKPIASKLKARNDEEYLIKMIISIGVQSIQDGDNPQFIEEKLLKLLPDYMLNAKAKVPKQKKSKGAAADDFEDDGRF